MADTITNAQRSLVMARIKSKNTAPELLVRRLIHALGYRYRLHQKHLPGNPDIVFKSRKKVIFVHGCFWHQHSKIACVKGGNRQPKSNTQYWTPKLIKNVERDNINKKALKDAGWSILIIWECEIRDKVFLNKKIKKFLD